MNAVTLDLHSSLRPMIVFVSLIGIDFGQVDRRRRLVRFAVTCYALLWVVVDASINMIVLVSGYKELELNSNYLTNLRLFFMYCNFAVQVLGCHFGLVWASCFYWAKLSSLLLMIFRSIEVDDIFYIVLRKLSWFGVAAILTVNYSIITILINNTTKCLSEF